MLHQHKAGELGADVDAAITNTATTNYQVSSATVHCSHEAREHQTSFPGLPALFLTYKSSNLNDRILDFCAGLRLPAEWTRRSRVHFMIGRGGDDFSNNENVQFDGAFML